MIILSVILIGCLIGSIIFYFKAKEIKLLRIQEQEIINREIEQKKELNESLLKSYDDLENKYNTFLQTSALQKQRMSDDLKDYKAHIELQKENIKNNFNNYKQVLQEDHDSIRESLDEDIAAAQEELNTLRESLRAGAEASARARAIKEKQEFYKLKVTEKDLRDIKLLNEFKLQLTNPVILSKLIWSQYFLNEASALCRRVLGEGKKCGIYKITNLDTDQCYIGQSVDVAQRWKDHIKCGLGIEAPATNILYNNMQKDGVWNYSFELLEECSKDQLNAKEKQWIDFYNSAELGFNKTRGNN